MIEHTGQAVEHLAGLDPEWIGLCLDTCHLAVAFEDPAEALGRLHAAGVPVVKTQASCALQADDPRDPATRAALAAFAEPRFLHQTKELVELAGVAHVRGVDDLPDALAGGLDGNGTWRVHFHVPLHADPAAPLTTTRPVLADALAALVGGQTARTDHIEVETYTWTVLPGGSGVDGTVEGIAAEMAWIRDQLLQLGLEALEG